MLIFDGDCGICTTSARWVRRRAPAGTQIVPWQEVDDLAALDLTVDAVTTAAYWVDRGGRTHRGHRAVARSLIAVGGGWALLGWALLTPPISWAAQGLYRLVADNRGRLPGATDACRRPS